MESSEKLIPSINIILPFYGTFSLLSRKIPIFLLFNYLTKIWLKEGF